MKIYLRTDKGVSAECRDHREAHQMCGEALSRGERPSIRQVSDAQPSDGWFGRPRPFDRQKYLAELEEQKLAIQLRELQKLVALSQQKGYIVTV